MPTEALACPNCRAPDPTGPDGNGEYLCIYCGTRFHRSAQARAPTPQPLAAKGVAAPRAPQANTKAPLIVIGAGIAVMLSSLVMVILLAPAGPEQGEAEVSAKPARTVPASKPAVAKPATVPEPTSVQAPAGVTAKPEPPPAPPSGDFVFHRIMSGYQTSFYALGMITNTSEVILDKPKVNAVLLDAEGKELGTDFGFAARDVLGPGQSSPIKILVNDPPEHASVRYELVVKEASWVPTIPEGLRAEPMPPKPAKFGNNRWDVEGKVFNEGTQPAKFVSIEIQALDAEGKLVGLDTTFADGDVLAPGSSARFSYSMFVAEAPDHFEFHVSGRVAE